jgi:hypothetical protein
MRELPMLPSEDFAKIKRYFPRPHGVERVDDQRVISGIIYVIKKTACGGAMRPKATAPIRRYITASCGGVAWVCLTRYSRRSSKRADRRIV